MGGGECGIECGRVGASVEEGVRLGGGECGGSRVGGWGRVCGKESGLEMPMN